MGRVKLARMFTPAAIVVMVLIASVAVASVLAFQAIRAAESRQAVSDAMLRQYAELAAWEFSRGARREIETALMHALSRRAHPESKGRCECVALDSVEHWFEHTAEAGLVGLPDTLVQQVGDHLQATRPRSMMMEGSVRIRALGDRSAHLAAFRWEPHVGKGGGEIGLVTATASLIPALERAFERASLLPNTGAVELSQTFVDLSVTDANGTRLFRSPGTIEGPQPFELDLFPNETVGLRLRASMTPAFVATLGPEHGAGPSPTLIVSLALINALMVAVGLWQLGRERELTRLRSDFVAGVSHELRTPLAQIRMFTDTLLLDRVRNPGEGRRALEIISRETRRLTQLVENVLYFHRHQRLPAAPALEPIDLRVLAVEVVEDFRPLAASRRIGIEARVAPDAVVVNGNSDALRQVLLNLLDNAVKFGPPDSVVTVALTREPGVARLSVADRGAGVPRADRARIFRAFERGHTGGSGGAGIGLSVVHQIVSAHHGTVGVEDADDGGSRFVVSLPA